MYDHELTVAIQQERERAIREARLHHRQDLIHQPTWWARLRAAARPGRDGQSANPIRPTHGSASTTAQADTSGPAVRPCTECPTTAA